ncbi:MULTISPECIES: Lrp/AsnC family transcriptional regulator [Pseudovibrio]|uniref:Lrp/AsnC family transcriptional regulator n=1 Tax=Stappiaceae TaxID=2821832 RepID=UPI00236595F0|nr:MULTISPECIES: Lrp/AsnC family transcriptional regulator [Pseudovibrio]MDD7911710.1 Lrp/AsnC family transcriptional regulator [Pseudovibrio exalbescens]MDX5594840.1 Lrp/AsnC family transcriptional regulator [Pseudovibrio sp. SPO723]
MASTVDLDPFDLKILASLQEDASRTNQEIGTLIHLSASQVSRRRQRLETAGVIRRYRADLSPDHLGFGVIAFVGVTLDTHNNENSVRFHELTRSLDCVQEAYTMTGDMDYLLKVCVPDLKGLSKFINNDLLPHQAVENVRSSIAMETIKDENQLPLGKV